MFFTLILENANGDQVDMTATANQYMTSRVEGLNPPTGTISTSSYAGMDGSYLNNAFIEKRNVVIHFEMRGAGIEARRHQLYKVFKPSRYIKIYYKTAGIDVFTEGYVETCEVNNFELFTTGQISILCPDIYWYANETQTAEYSQVLGAFHFICPDDDKPFPIGQYNTENMMTIVNDGDDTGMTLVISGGPARNPTIYNADTDEYMQIQGEIEEGDIITITTKTGDKTVTLEREGIPEPEYIELLKTRGSENIVPLKIATESEIAANNTQYVYGKDYAVGDYVTVQHRRFGMIQPKIQLTGMIEAFDQNGRSLTPTFQEV